MCPWSRLPRPTPRSSRRRTGRSRSSSTPSSPLDAAALNAGIGVNGDSSRDIPLEDDLQLIAVNVNAVVHLAKRVLPGMVERGVGWVLITSSVAATMPGPYYATYAASKAFLQSFAQAIRFELKDTGVTVTALQPGPTDTDFFERAGMEDTKIAEASKDDPAEVARDGFEALMAGKDHVIAGSGKNKAQVAGAKPQRWRGKKLLTSVNDRSAAAVWRRGGSGAWRWRQLRRRQAYQNSGKPCSSATRGPAPASTQCTPTSTHRWAMPPCACPVRQSHRSCARQP
ncbi:MAG: SDR family NAD(P)-dependent oxidoreductase [Actinomycetes bacterium]